MPSFTAVRGLWCATLTPLDRAGHVDHARMVAHVHRIFTQGVDGVAPFGTTGEGQSFAVNERRGGIDALLKGGVPATKIVAATGCAALPETIALTQHAVQSGCAAVLVLPPFFWKEPTDEGLFNWYAQLIEGTHDSRLKILLYHLPQVSSVPLSVDLIERLATAFPDTVVGIKDSAGNWAHTAAILERCPQLAVMVGHEPHLPRLMRAGGVGTICGVSNLRADLVQALLERDVTADAEARIERFVKVAFSQPLMAGLKSMLADQLNDPPWCTVRAPLVALTDAQRQQLRATLATAELESAASVR
ncbi:MAG: dihydrodipicolinate synthase family protein [Betaproteobacteria bacterium]